MAYKTSRLATKSRRRLAGATTVRFTEQDRAAAEAIVAAGWATTFTGALRFALKFASERVAGELK